MSEMGEKATGDDGRDFGCKGRKWEKIRPAGTSSREVMRSISGSWSNRVEFYVVAQFLQSAHEALLRVVTISLIKVIAPHLFIAMVLTQHVVDDHQNGMP